MWATTHAHPAIILTSYNIPMAMPITDQQIYAMSSRVEALAIDDLAEQLEVDCVLRECTKQAVDIVKNVC